jgi:phosphonate transport system ATP-binding protein
MVELDNVGVLYPGGTAGLRGVSLRAGAGEFVALLGPSGAGKSSLLRSINGLAPAATGEVRVNGVRVERRTLPSIRRQVATIFQQASLVARASVLANVLSGALRDLPMHRSLLGWWPRSWQARACGLLQEVGLREEHLYRRTSQLSGGEQQRVGIARAFMASPRVLLADEPVASLDPVTSYEILGLLRKLARERGCTVLCSLHQVELARVFADRAIALRQGVLVWDGPMAALEERTVDAVYVRA